MAWILLGPHGEPIAEATEVAGFGIEDAAAPEPEASVAECEDEVAEVSNLLNAHSELLECRLQFRPPFPEAFVPVKGLAASTSAVSGCHSISGWETSSNGPTSLRLYASTPRSKAWMFSCDIIAHGVSPRVVEGASPKLPSQKTAGWQSSHKSNAV
jgi:hypothetical protein